jgi:hypothetical protein
MTYKIEKNVPIPASKNSSAFCMAKNMIAELGVGDMARLYGRYKQIPSSTYHKAAKSLGYTVAYRTLKNISGKPSLCLWRTE